MNNKYWVAFSSIEEIVGKSLNVFNDERKIRSKAVCISDHGVMFGLYELFDNEHLKNKCELKNDIINLLETLTENEIRYIYKTIHNIKQLK